MRKKLLSKTYLRDVSAFEIKYFIGEQDYYLVVKKFIKVDKPFIIENGECLIDDDFFMVEILPKEANYQVRYYINDKGKMLQRYIDITRENGLDEDSKIPYYDDLYLDIVLADDEIRILDEDELKQALEDKKISKEDFDLANKTLNNLLLEIESNSNKYLNFDFQKYLW